MQMQSLRPEGIKLREVVFLQDLGHCQCHDPLAARRAFPQLITPVIHRDRVDILRLKLFKVCRLMGATQSFECLKDVLSDPPLVKDL
ncbi:hypothetical protein D3C76_1317650 [compost metagenome]